MNHATTIQTTDAQVAKRLLRFLAADESWLFEHRSEAGLAWLDLHFGTGKVRDMLAGHKLFWTWWANAWAGRDMTLSNRLKVNNTGVMTIRLNTGASDFIHEPEEFVVYYLAGHNPEKLTIQLDKVVLAAIIKSSKKEQ